MSVKNIKYQFNLIVFNLKMWFFKFETDLPSKIERLENWEPPTINWYNMYWHQPAHSSYGRTSRFPRTMPVKFEIIKGKRFSFKSIPYNFGGVDGHGVRYDWIGLSITCWNKKSH